MGVITISRQYGSRGEQIGRQIARTLGYTYCDKAILANVARMADVNQDEIREYDETHQPAISNVLRKLFLTQPIIASELPYLYPPTIPSAYPIDQLTNRTSLDPDTVSAFFSQVLHTLWHRSAVVIIGRASQIVLAGKSRTLHIRFVARIEDRVETVMVNDVLTKTEAQHRIASIDKARANYLKTHHKIDWDDPTLYHLLINTRFLDIEHVTSTVVAAVDRLPKSD